MTNHIGTLRNVRTSMLDLAYLESGPADGPAVVLVHGFPYDVHAYEEVAPRLAAAGCRVIVPHVRGYGATRFRDASIPRSGEQAALGKDLMELIELLGIEAPVLGGYDWGGRACCIAAALMPERVKGLVTGGGYNMIAAPDANQLLPPGLHHNFWYQYYLHRPHAHAQLAAQRNEYCRYIWSAWSPNWKFDDATFARSAESFANPDWVDVVVHSYRQRHGLAQGDPALAELARATELRPQIAAPTIALYGDTGELARSMGRDGSRFTGKFDTVTLPGVGHNVPQEAPEAFAEAVLRLV